MAIFSKKPALTAESLYRISGEIFLIGYCRNFKFYLTHWIFAPEINVHRMVIWILCYYHLTLMYHTFRSKNSRRGRRSLKPSKMLVLIVLWFLLKPKRMPISWHAFCQTKASQPPPFMEIVSNVKGQAHHMFS